MGFRRPSGWRRRLINYLPVLTFLFSPGTIDWPPFITGEGGAVFVLFFYLYICYGDVLMDWVAACVYVAVGEGAVSAHLCWWSLVREHTLITFFVKVYRAVEVEMEVLTITGLSYFHRHTSTLYQHDKKITCTSSRRLLVWLAATQLTAGHEIRQSGCGYERQCVTVSRGPSRHVRERRHASTEEPHLGPQDPTFQDMSSLYFFCFFFSSFFSTFIIFSFFPQ